MADDDGNYGHPPMATLNDMTPPGPKASPYRVRLSTVLVVIIVAVLLILAVKPNELDVYKTFNELQFADPALARCVKESAIANKWRDVGHAQKLRCNNPSGDGITSLEGIEHLVELSEINLAFNHISDTGPLATLPRLETVDLSHNSVSELPVLRSAPILRRIELNYNQIESLEWLAAEHFLALESFSVVHNHISDVTEIPALDGIRELSIRDNAITDLEPIWQLHNLVMLDAGKNLVEDISGIGELRQLGRLFLDRNHITRLNGIEHLHRLEELDLANNRLQSTAPLASLERLQRLNLNQTGITGLTDILALGDLDLLRVSGNPDLACEDIAAAKAEYGATSIRSDKQCPGAGDKGDAASDESSGN